ncbi:MAG: ABC transporter substrate-binding protein, partial [Betaproteobacteria bacterium]|nr:ABC transporter substrate-binding protein [Betaproteobacteria bacterium]
MRGWLLALWLAASPAWPQEPPIVVGAVVSESGQLADFAGEMRKALILWQEGRNAAGGLLGRQIELRLLDDRSEASAALGLYGQLIERERADLLIGPFGSAASAAAAVIAENAHRVLVNATGVTRGAQRANRRYVFQVPAPLAEYGEGALALARAAGYSRLQVVARGEPGAGEAASRFAAEAAALGMQAVTVTMAAGTADYGAQIAAARSRRAEAWIAFGRVEDAAEMVKSFKRAGYAPSMFLAQGAAEPGFVRRVGQDAEFALGIAAYDPRFATPGNAEFVARWRKRWTGEPGLAAANAYAAALVLEEAVRAAGTLDQERLRAVLAVLDTETPIGRYRVGEGGVQLGAR